MTTDQLADTLEANHKFVASCRAVANNPGAHRFANTEAGNDAYEAMMAFRQTISDEAVPARREAEKEILAEYEEMRIALEVEAEKAKLADARLKANAMIESYSKTLAEDLAQPE